MARGTDGRWSVVYHHQQLDILSVVRPSNSFSTPVWHGMFCFRDLLRELQRRCGLRPTRHVSTREQLAIFLRIARTGQGNLEMQERFQRSGDTISKYGTLFPWYLIVSFNCDLDQSISSDSQYACLKGVLWSLRETTSCRWDPKRDPWWSTILPLLCKMSWCCWWFTAWCFVSAADMARYRSRKGRISTNLFAACRFSLLFCYMLSRWEGSAADSWIFNNAWWTDFLIAPRTYYLGDAGFPLCDALLVPYRGVHYHLKVERMVSKWAKVMPDFSYSEFLTGIWPLLRPANEKELFNLRYASLWNVTEWIFGVCKWQFKLTVAASEYSVQTQSKIPLALAALHNFICLVDPEDDADIDGDNEAGETPSAAAPINLDHLGSHISQVEKDQASAMRHDIARVMWGDYQRELAEWAEQL